MLLDVMLIPYDPEDLMKHFSGFSIIVEGMKDKKALESLGLQNVFPISGKSIDTFVENLPQRGRYVILTDFDKEGESKKRKLYKLLIKNRFTVNENLRKVFRGFFGVTKIEELIKISKFKEDVYHGKISSIDYKILNRSGFFRRWYSRETRRNWSNIWTN